MEFGMSERDNQNFLIKSIEELEETTALRIVRERIESGEDPLIIIEDAKEGMQRVGLLFEQQKYFISGLMMAGEIFRQIMEVVEPQLVRKLKGNAVGHIILGTVKGDIHDIGKNIFCILLRCYGFTVTDLGEDVEPALFIENILGLKPDVVAFSGLITSAYDSMRETIQQIRKLENATLSSLPIVIGGGLINEKVCEFVGANYWASDAMEGVEICREIIR
jgi:methanogenic corrinoid protein MtbC1